MVWNISVGNYKLAMMERVEITRSVELLSDTAIVTLPATAYNQALDIESKIKRGDRVKIWLGYDDHLILEFDGYLESIVTDGGSLKLNCEDAIFLYRVSLEDKELKNVDVKDILTHVNKAVSAYYPSEKAFDLSCDYSFTYDKFVIKDATGYDVLKKIQEEAKPNVYLKDRKLHVHPQYSEIFGKVNYDFSENIETSNLKYRLASDRKLLVEVESKDLAGNVIKVEAGTTGGDKVTIKVSGVTNKDSLTALANEALKQRVYTGYEGSFTGWMQPYCDAGYQVTITDKDYEYKNGTYYVIEVKVEFDSGGGKRIVKIGKKIGEK